jgi:hypothetical protein
MLNIVQYTNIDYKVLPLLAGSHALGGQMQ